MTVEKRKSRKGESLNALMERARLGAILALIDRCKGETPRILQVGCGRGTLTAALVGKGFLVDTIGGIQAIVNAEREFVAQRNLDHMVRVHRCSYTAIPFDDGTFDGIVALDLLPWLKESRHVILELTRVLKPGGYLVVDALNRYGFHELLDPRRSPFLEPLRSGLARALTSGRLRSRRFQPQFPVTHSRNQLVKELSGYGMQIIDERSIGFGPVTLFGRRILGDSAGKKVHTVLQGYAARGVPVVRFAGRHHVLLATRGAKEAGSDWSVRAIRSNRKLRISGTVSSQQEEVSHEAIYE